MRTREEIITSMCMTWRHDYGINKVGTDAGKTFIDTISSGMTADERKILWNHMAQIYDNDIAPYMQPKSHM